LAASVIPFRSALSVNGFSGGAAGGATDLSGQTEQADRRKHSNGMKRIDAVLAQNKYVQRLRGASAPQASANLVMMMGAIYVCHSID
jgi:hypothetical protein